MTEPLLRSSDSRYVMFPIEDKEIWDMYKRQVDCFWRAEEIDLSKDLVSWTQQRALPVMAAIIGTGCSPFTNPDDYWHVTCKRGSCKGVSVSRLCSIVHVVSPGR